MACRSAACRAPDGRRCRPSPWRCRSRSPSATGWPSTRYDEHVRRLEVAVDARRADGRAAPPGRSRGTAPAARRRRGGSASQKVVTRSPSDQLHHEVRAAVRRGAGVEHPRDVGWSNRARRLPLALEARDDPSVSMPRLTIFSATSRRRGSVCSGAVDDAHAALAERLQDVVRADRIRHRPGRQGARVAGRLIAEPWRARCGCRLASEVTGRRRRVRGCSRVGVVAGAGESRKAAHGFTDTLGWLFIGTDAASR